MKKFVLGALALSAVTVTALAGCGNPGDEYEKGRVVENGKIGFILPSGDGEETKAFKANWEALAKEYGVTVVFEPYTQRDPSYYGQLADKLIAAKCDAIICNFEMDGKENVIEKAVENEVYVAYSGSTVSDEVFEEWETNPYFLGQIAPTPAEEIAQAKAMTKHFVEKYWGANKVDAPEGTNGHLAVWPVDFHGITLHHQMTYRYKGMKEALAEYGVTINGDDKDDSSKWTVSYAADSILKDKVDIMANSMADMGALMAQCGAVLATNPTAVITSTNGDMLFSMFVGQGKLVKGTEFGTVDGFVNGYAKWYTAAPAAAEAPAGLKIAHNPYLVGKFGAINQGILALVCKAFAGEPIRNEGKAITINQTYWHSTTKDEFDEALAVSKAFSWKKADFDAITTVAQLQALYDNATLANLKAKLPAAK